MRAFSSSIVLLGFLALAGLGAVPAAHAQSTWTCPYQFLCADTTAADVSYGSVELGVSASVDGTSNGLAAGQSATLTNGASGAAVGPFSSINGTIGAAIGPSANVSLQGGNPDNVSNIGGTAVGPSASVSGLAGIAIGPAASSTGAYDIVAGRMANAGGSDNIVFGNQSSAPFLAQDNVVIGGQSSVGNGTTNSVVLGANTSTTESSVVAVGNRRLIQLAPGQDSTDGVAMSQLYPLAASLGGGSTFNTSTGVFTAPNYVLDGNAFNNVGSALTYLDTRIDGIPGGGSGGVNWIAATGTSSATATGAVGAGDISIGPNSATSGIQNSALGDSSQAGNVNTSQNTAVGAGAVAGTNGSSANATGGQATSVGANSSVQSLAGTAIGQGASLTQNAQFSVAVGAGTTTDRAFTVAVGNRTISQLSDGTQNTDAVTVEQITPMATYLGGGSGFTNGAFNGPTYVLTNPYTAGSYYNVGSALLALDTGLTDLSTTVSNLPTGGGTQGPPGPTGPQGPAGPTGPQGPAGTNRTNGTDPLAVHYDNSTDSTVTLQGQGGTTIANVKAGVAPDDAVNVQQLDAQTQQAISTANAYTNVTNQQTLQSANAYTDWRFSQLNDKFSQAQAMAQAQSQAAANAAAQDGGPNRWAVAPAYSGGQEGAAIEYMHKSDNGVVFNVGAAFSHGQSSIGFAVGGSW